MEGALAIASAPTIATVAESMSSGPIMWVGVTTRTAIAATPGVDVPITVTRLLIIGVPHTTDGLTIRGPRRFITRGAGARHLGMATTVLTSRRTPSIRRPHSG